MRRALLSFALTAAPACALHHRQSPADSASGGVSQQSQARSLASTVEGEELRSTGLSKLYDALRQVRPAFFASRGATSILNEPVDDIVTIIDRQIVGDESYLQRILVVDVRRVRRLSPTEVQDMTSRPVSIAGIEVTLRR